MNIKTIASCIFLLLITAPLTSQNKKKGAHIHSATPETEKFQTYYEQHGFNHTPRYEETIAYCRLLAESSPLVTFTSIGQSAQGREIPLLIVDKDGYSTAEQVRSSSKAVVLIEACIHAGEPDGKEAGFMLIRDMVLFNKHKELLDQVTLLFIPIFNTDGHEQFSAYNRINQNGPEELGTRATAQRINLNRDFIKADAPEMRCWLKLFNTWDPELFIDVHVTNGADFQYVITYSIENSGFMEKGLAEWSQQVFEKELKERMRQDKFPIFPYFSFREYGKPEKGVLPESFPPQYSHGYVAARNRLGLLLENHIYKPYKQRVDATYKILVNALALVNTHREEIQSRIKEADRAVASLSSGKERLPLLYKNTFKDSIPDTFLGWKAHTIKSDLSGGEWLVQDYTKPVSIPTHIYNSFEPVRSVQLPQAYIISAENREVIGLLDLHGIKYTTLKESAPVAVETYRFTPKSQWSKTPYEGRFVLTPDITVRNETVTYPAGSAVVDMSQPLAKIAAFLLEPLSPTSLAYWGFFNNYVRPASEFFINLRYMEVKGREMLAKDPALKAAFEQKKRTDPQFASDPNAILQFFMNLVRKNVEPDANLYPVGRIIRE